MSDIFLYNNEMWKVKYKYTYTGNPEPFNLDTGRYLCICKGASGGCIEDSFRNKGGCSYGILNLQSPLSAFAVVGSNGGDGTKSAPGMGGYNGGGNGGHSAETGTYIHGAGGGGASDIRLNINPDIDITTKHTVPDEYDEVEYIESDGTQYIDTGYIHKVNTKIECVCEVSSSISIQWGCLFGARNYGTYNSMALFTRYDYSNTPTLYCNSGRYDVITDGGFPYNNKTKVVVYNNTATWYDVDNNYIGKIVGGTQTDGRYSTYIFEFNNGGYPDGSKNIMKLYSFKIYEDDTLLHWYIPVKSKDETQPTIGLFDIITDTLLQKRTGNEFTTGDVVETKTGYDEVKTIHVSLLSRIMVAGGAGGQGVQNKEHNDYADFTGYGGGINGGYPCTKSTLLNDHKYPTQSNGYSLGKGEDGIDKNQASSGSTYALYGISGAGGGWYGGYTSNVPSTSETYSCANGGGGSGYVLTESSYKPDEYMYGVEPRDDLYFSNTLMTAGLANEACIIICEPVDSYYAGDRLICECIGSGTKFKLYTGKYRMKCSGGQGAHRSKYVHAQKGGYAEGIVNVPEIVDAYAYVGGSSLYATSKQGAEFIQGTHPTHSFNGGGKPSGYSSINHTAESGGGGTDIRIGEDSLFARILVAGGAGGCGYFDYYGGAGGGLSGDPYMNGNNGTNYGPGTQTNAGSGSNTTISGGFGYGGNGMYKSGDGGNYGGAGGGGWYGGSGTEPNNWYDNDRGGSGGSGYVLTEDSYKPDGYLLDDRYYLEDTLLITGAQERLFPAPITGIVIDVLYAATYLVLAHDREGYKYYDTNNQRWTFLKNDDITIEDFNEYGVYIVDTDDGLNDEYDLYIYDKYNISNIARLYVIPPRGSVKFRYHTPNAVSRYNIDADIDNDVMSYDIDITRKGIAETAYLYFDFIYDIKDIPTQPFRLYSIQGLTQGASIEYHEHKKKEKTLSHIDLLPVGRSRRMPARFKNYIGSFINGSEAITTINSAISCSHNRCIYTLTLCNDSVVRIAKLNLVSNVSTIIKDIPKSQFGNTYYGDIKVDDEYIYVTSATDESYMLIRTPNSSDTTVNIFQVTNENNYKINSSGKMEWYDSHTLVLLLRRGIAFFNTKNATFEYKIFSSGQNGVRRDMIVGKKKMLSLYTGNSKSAYVIDMETGVCEGLVEAYGQQWVGEYINAGCYHDGTFYVAQRNRLHMLDEESMVITKSVPTPFTDMDPKQLIYGDGIIYILIQNRPALYAYEIATEKFYAVEIPFSIDNYTADGWIKMCTFKGYCFIPQIRMYTVSFADNAKYNMGYKCDQFVVIMNKATSENPDYQFEYDDRFVTFTDDNMMINNGNVDIPLREVDTTNHIKIASISKDQYNKIIDVSFIKINNESEGT
jgi:hypothetical protein